MGDDDTEIVRTHVGLYRRHREWAADENKNLSAVIRDLLDEKIDDGRTRSGSGWD
jgi:hypothetical protein